MGETLKELV